MKIKTIFNLISDKARDVYLPLTSYRGFMLTPYLLPLTTLLLFTAYPLPLTAAFSSKSAGTSAATFLKIGAGARPTGLGEAYTGVADDVNSIYWNTAGLSTLKKNEFVAMRAELFQGLQYNFFAFAYPTKRIGTFAVGLNNLSISEIEQRSADTDKPDTTFSSNDSAYTLAYALRLPIQQEDGLHIGVGMKYIRQTLAGSEANSYAADIGSLYRFSGSPISLGMTVQNLGTKVKFKSEEDALPLTLKVGGSYRLGESWGISKGKDAAFEEGSSGLKSGLLLTMDVSLPRDDNPSVKVGTEFTRMWSENMGTSLRGAGYQIDKRSQVSGTVVGVSAGAGFTFKYVSLDFAWMPFRDLGNTYRYSVKLRF